MINLLVSDSSVVLKDVVVLGPSSLDKLLYNWQDLHELIIRDVGQLLAVGLWNDQGMTAGEWLNVEEGKDFIGLKELERWDVAWRVSLATVATTEKLCSWAEGGWANWKKGEDKPLIILQKIQEAILLTFIGFVVKRGSFVDMNMIGLD